MSWITPCKAWHSLDVMVDFIQDFPLHSIDGSSREHLLLMATSFFPHKKHLLAKILPDLEEHKLELIFVLGQFAPSHASNVDDRTHLFS